MADATIAALPEGVQDIIGWRYGRWTVTRFSHNRVKKNGHLDTHWVCHCDCGTERPVSMANLVLGYTKSCGCYKRDKSTTHGMSRGAKKHPLYNMWKSMRWRCQNPNAPRYDRYGGRGIFVCDKWGTFLGFLEDMLPTWKPGLTLDRIDNDGPYTKENCRWATVETQMNNISKNVRIIYKGESKTVMEIVRLGVSKVCEDTLRNRLERGWTIEDALRMPPSGGNRSFHGKTKPSPYSAKARVIRALI